MYYMYVYKLYTYTCVRSIILSDIITYDHMFYAVSQVTISHDICYQWPGVRPDGMTNSMNFHLREVYRYLLFLTVDTNIYIYIYMYNYIYIYIHIIYVYVYAYHIDLYI